jgi:hypothetical protein
MTFTAGGGTKFILVYLNYAIFMVYLMTMPVIQDYTGRVIPITLPFYGVSSSQYRPTCAAQLRATEIHSPVRLLFI